MDTPKKFWKLALPFWGLCLLAIACLALFSHSLRGQEDVTIVRVPLIPIWGAVTTCDQRGNIVIVVNSMNSPGDSLQVISHERVHVRQMREFEGGCKPFLKKYRAESTFRFQMEAEAHCMSYHVLVSQGMPRENFSKLILYMQQNYGKDLSLEEVEKLLPCKEESLTPTDGTTAPP